MSTRKLRVAVVDDEPLARERITSLLQAYQDVEVVAQCQDGARAVAAIRQMDPDLVFLDVQMPGLTGFEVLERLGSDRLPMVIFVTAYDKYALRAFEVHALDYLLKPFDRERFDQALQRARNQVDREANGDLGRRLLALVHDIKPPSAPAGPAQRTDRLVVKAGGRVFFVRTDEIDWVEAEGNYVRLHLGQTSHLFRETMTALESKLDARMFVRIHRSRIVNMERIKELQPWFNGEYRVVLHNGTTLALSRGYREKLQERLGRSF